MGPKDVSAFFEYMRILANRIPRPAVVVSHRGSPVVYNNRFASLQGTLWEERESELFFHDAHVQNTLHNLLRKTDGWDESRAVSFAAKGSLYSSFSLTPLRSENRAHPFFLIEIVLFHQDETFLKDFASAFNLTNAEAQTLLILISGVSEVTEIASRRGVSVHTVRNQLASLLRKTDQNSKAGLLSLVLREAMASSEA